MKLAIIIAMESEAQPLRNALNAVKTGNIRGIGCFSLEYKAVDLTVAVSGEGKIGAAVAAAVVAESLHPDIMMNFGVAGSLNGTAKGGKIIAGDVWEHDFDITAAGWLPGKFRGRTDDGLAETVIEAVGGERGTVATGDVFVADPVRSAYIAETFGAKACEMECAAVFAVASAYGIPFAAVKYISDGADGDAKNSMDANVRPLSEKIASDIFSVMDRLSGE